MSTSSFLRPWLVLLPVGIFCTSASAQVATDSASRLLTELATACQFAGGDGNGGGDGNPGEFEAILEQAGFASGRAARSASADPGSTFCQNLNTRLVSIEEENANDPAALEAAQANLAASLTPDEMPALYTSLVQLSTNQIRNVSQHLRGRRSRQQVEEATITAHNGMHSYYGGNAGDELSGRFSVFVDGARVEGDQDQTTREVGYDLETDHLTVGVDYRISDALIAGFAYGNSDTSLRYSEAENQTDNKTDHYILYASWYRDNFAVDTLLAHASGEFDTHRNVLGTTALGSTDNQLTYFSLAGSYDFVSGGVTWGSFASFDYLDGQIDAFQEQGDGGWEVAFSGQDVKSQIYAMGLHANKAISFGWGVLVPHVRGEWRTELEDEQDLIVGRFVQDPASSFTLATDDPDDNWFQASAGISAQFAHGIAVFADYEEVLEYEETTLRSLTLGLRWEL